MEVPYKTKTGATIGSNNLTPGHKTEENHSSEGYIHLSVHCSDVYNSQDMEASSLNVH